MKHPLVSCIMPTCNRRVFVPYAIQYFLQQDYPNKELLIVDDGTDCINDLIPDDPQIRYLRFEKNMTLGEKRNFCVRESNGDLIMHWDDDDWMASYRISYQVKELLLQNADICGLQKIFFCEIETGNCWLYKYPPNARAWLAGGSLLYTKDFWKKSPFPDMQVASDTKFIFSRKLEKYVVLDDYAFYVATIHKKNTCQKKTANNLWSSIDPTVVRDIIREDLPHFTALYNRTLKTAKNEVLARKKIAILITTCNRAASLKRIINDLQKESGCYEIEYFIVDDDILGNGKKYYWKTINILWEKARGQNFDYYIQLPDDVQLNDNFIKHSIELWQSVTDNRKICLNLLLDGHRIGKTCWTNFWPELSEFNEHRFLKTQWVDMFFISKKMLFEELGWNILPIPLQRWQINPELSSGVGQQISNRLHQKNWHIYQITENVAEHIGCDSIMNPLVRAREPLKFAHLVKIYASIASIPERENQLKRTVSSILPYVDRLFLFLNDYTKIPSWLTNYVKVIPYLSNVEKTNMGDGGKFFGLNKISHENYYYFTLDDDMIYPPEYVWKMIEKIEKYHRRCIVGCGGYIMKPSVSHFYNDRQANWHISIPNTVDRSVHILHTCLTAWHSSSVKFQYENCVKPNMADLWLALSAQQQKVPMILIERPPNWVKNQVIPTDKTIYGRYRNNCNEQTSIYNSWSNWKLIEAQ